ncbi:MAG: hypothetical protein QM796_16295 [Chthoniobacteraceae bacterium]
MAFHYSTVETGGQKLDILTDDHAGLRIAVSRIGAELISISRRNEAGEWVGFLHRDGEVEKPASGWGNHATVMGYFLHRLKGEKSNYLGHEICGGNHSFLRSKHFPAPEHHDENSLTYRLEPDQIAPHEYPFKVGFQLTYELVGDTLRINFVFHNYEDHDCHVSFGLHPGFAVTSIADAELKMAAGRYVRLFAPGNFLSGETETIDFPGGDMPFDKEKLPDSYLLDLSGVHLPLFVLADPATHKVLYLNFSGVPYATIWSDGGPFICVEPCWGMPDHHEQRPFEQKLGIQTIAACGHLTRSFSISPQFQ